MNDDQLNDLKQFIDSRLSQTESSLNVRFDYKFDTLRTEIHDAIGGISDALEQIHEQLDAEHSEVDQRFKKLEQRTTA